MSTRTLFCFSILVIACILECAQCTFDVGSDTVVCAPETAAINAGDLNIFHPASPPAREIRELAWLVLGICAVIFVIVEGVLVWAIIRYRKRMADAGEPVQVFGSNPIELAWTVIPTIIVFVLALATLRTIREVQLTEPPEGSLHVDVIGHQWWWEFRLPTLNGEGTIITANELIVPVGRPIWLSLHSADVIHSWWVPRMNGKTDVIPNHINHTWFQADMPGIFLGQCAEYCGTQHANMLIRVHAVPTAEFEAWCVAQSLPPSLLTESETTAHSGRDLFLELACMNCHAIDGVSNGAFGPNLTHLMSRTTIGAGAAILNPQTLRAWVDDPQNLKVGCNMPSLKLDPNQLDSIVAYLLTLK